MAQSGRVKLTPLAGAPRLPAKLPPLAPAKAKPAAPQASPPAAPLAGAGAVVTSQPQGSETQLTTAGPPASHSASAEPLHSRRPAAGGAASEVEWWRMDEEHVILSGKWGKRQRRIYKWDCELISLLLHAVAMNHYRLLVGGAYLGNNGLERISLQSYGPLHTAGQVRRSAQAYTWPLARLMAVSTDGFLGWLLAQLSTGCSFLPTRSNGASPPPVPGCLHLQEPFPRASQASFAVGVGLFATAKLQLLLVYAGACCHGRQVVLAEGSGSCRGQWFLQRAVVLAEGSGSYRGQPCPPPCRAQRRRPPSLTTSPDP